MTNPLELPNWIMATEQTQVKPGEGQVGEYARSEVVTLEPGEKYFVRSYSKGVGGHWHVEIEHERFDHMPVQVIYDHPLQSHYECSWEQDYVEKEIIQPIQVNTILSQDVGDKLMPGDDLNTLITPHITYGEFALYQQDRRFNYKHQCQTAFEICSFLEQTREHFGGNALWLTSGHRPPAINAMVGGATYSEHLFSEPMVGAVDFYIDGVSVHDLQNYCDDKWNGSVGYGADRGFVHLGLRRGYYTHRWYY